MKEPVLRNSCILPKRVSDPQKYSKWTTCIVCFPFLCPWKVWVKGSFRQLGRWVIKVAQTMEGWNLHRQMSPSEQVWRWQLAYLLHHLRTSKLILKWGSNMFIFMEITAKSGLCVLLFIQGLKHSSCVVFCIVYFICSHQLHEMEICKQNEFLKISRFIYFHKALLSL